MMSKPKDLYVCECDLASESMMRWATTPEDGYAHYRLVTPPKPKRDAIAYVVKRGMQYAYNIEMTSWITARACACRWLPGSFALSSFREEATANGARVVKLVRKVPK